MTKFTKFLENHNIHIQRLISSRKLQPLSGIDFVIKFSSFIQMVVLEKKNDFSIQNGIAGKKLISEVKQVFSQKSIQPEQDEFSL